MRIIQIFWLVSFLILSFVSCSNEKVINIDEQPWYLLAADNSSGNKLSLYKYPDNVLVEEDVITVNNPDPLPGEVTKIVEFRDNLYLFIPEAFRIDVIDENNFTRLAVIDFSEEGLVPSDICFPNATDAYVAHGNDSVVTLVDITNFEKARVIHTGPEPVSIDCAGNQIFVVNKGNNIMSVIDSRTHEVTSEISTDPVPLFVKTVAKGNEVLVISQGFGKGYGLDEKTEAIAAYFDVGTKKLVQAFALEFGAVSSLDFVPVSLTITGSDWAFVGENQLLLRIDTRLRDRVVFVKRQFYDDVEYDYHKQDLILLSQELGQYEITIADQNTGKEIVSYPIPGKISAYIAL